MKHGISYKNFRIRGESFRPTQSSGWIPSYVLQPEKPKADADPSPVCRDRLDEVFDSENAADEFAVQDAKSWIDSHGAAAVDVALPAVMTGGFYVVNKPIA